MNKSILASSQWLDGKIQGKSQVVNGVIVNATAPYVFSGRNLFDYNGVEVGYIVNGSNYPLNYCLRTKDYIQVNTSTKYRFSLNFETFGLSRIDEYDINKTFIKETIQPSNNAYEITTTSTTKYIKITFGNRLDNTINYNQIGIPNESITQPLFQLSTETATTYVPYIHTEYSRTGRVDLGSLSDWYSLGDTTSVKRYYSYSLRNVIKTPTSSTSLPNIFINNYKVSSQRDCWVDKIDGTICIGPDGYIGIASSTISVVTQISGILEYEPATQLELRSAGTVKDTLSNCDGKVVRNVGTRAYQSGDENNPNYLTDGTTTNYPLATPTTEQHASLAIPKLATKCTDANGMEIDIERNN